MLIGRPEYEERGVLNVLPMPTSMQSLLIDGSSGSGIILFYIMSAQSYGFLTNNEKLKN
jgi:hypothetical protein